MIDQHGTIKYLIDHLDTASHGGKMSIVQFLCSNKRIRSFKGIIDDIIWRIIHDDWQPHRLDIIIWIYQNVKSKSPLVSDISMVEAVLPLVASLPRKGAVINARLDIIKILHEIMGIKANKSRYLHRLQYGAYEVREWITALIKREGNANE
jgi:hypothetical protein